MRRDMVCPLCSKKGAWSKGIDWKGGKIKCCECGEWIEPNKWIRPGIWVSVSDLKPEPENFVLLWNGHWRGVGKRNSNFDPETDWVYEEWQDETTEFIEPVPTHWMALPLPPKE